MADSLTAIGRLVWPGLKVSTDETEIDVALCTTAEPIFYQAITTAISVRRPIRLTNPSGTLLMELAKDAVDANAAFVGLVAEWSEAPAALLATFPEAVG